MGSSALDLDKHRLALLAAKSDVVNGRAAASWALFAYEKANELKLLDSGGGGPNELARRFQSERIMYGLCRLSEPTTGRPRIVLIHWVGEDVPDTDQEACAGHLPAIRAFFQEAHLVLKASRGEEVTQEGLHSRLSSVAPPEQPPPDAACPKKDVGGSPEEEVVGTNYRKTNPGLELLHSQRSAFWAQVEREEEERRQEERRRAQEEERRWERLRMEEERREAAERERRVQEKEQLIQEQRKQQAQQEAEEQRREEARRREQARVLAGTRAGQSWASETAPQAAGPGGQRPHRGVFFQRRGRLGSSSREPGGPAGPPGQLPGFSGCSPHQPQSRPCPPTSVTPHQPSAAPTCPLSRSRALLNPKTSWERSPLLWTPSELPRPQPDPPSGANAPGPAQGTNRGAMDWVEPPSPTATSPPRAAPGGERCFTRRCSRPGWARPATGAQSVRGAGGAASLTGASCLEGVPCPCA